MFVDPGNTPLIKSKLLSSLFAIPDLYYKLEGSNPTGTHKDRIANGICRYVKKKGKDTVAVATCGNYGLAVAYYAKAYDLKCEVYIPEGYHSKRLIDIVGLGASIHFIPGKYEQVVKYSAEISANNNWFNASPNSKIVRAISVFQYSNISKELMQQIPDVDFIAVPVSNGTTFAGIYYGYYKEFKKGNLPHLPVFIAVSTSHGNPIISSLNKSISKIEVLDPFTLKESQVNEPLISYEPFDGQEALDILNSTKGFAFKVSDNQMIHLSKLLYDVEGLSVLPASASSLGAIQLLTKSNPSLSNKRFVCVFTGRGGVQTRVSNTSRVLSAIFEGRNNINGKETSKNGQLTKTSNEEVRTATPLWEKKLLL